MDAPQFLLSVIVSWVPQLWAVRREQSQHSSTRLILTRELGHPMIDC